MHSVLLGRGTNGPRMHRWTCVRNTLDVRYVFGRPQPTNVGTTNTQRVLRVCLALVKRALRISGVLHSCVELRAHLLCMHKNPDAHN